MPTVQHDDFGEKIGGAKKDLWKERGLTAGDLDGMNEREAEKYVRKDNIWERPDYDALIAGGTPADIAYFIKTVRDSLNASPRYLKTDSTPDRRAGRQRQYIDTVRMFGDVSESVKEIVFAYPKGEERAAINAAFDDLIAELKKDRHITHENKVSQESDHVRSDVRFSPSKDEGTENIINATISMKPAVYTPAPRFDEESMDVSTSYGYEDEIGR
jgi:hypothetical protein